LEGIIEGIFGYSVGHVPAKQAAATQVPVID